MQTNRSTRHEIFRLHAQFCQALSDPKRLLILVELRGGKSLTVSELARALATTQSNTSQHLAVLRQKGIVVATRDGSFVRYSLADKRILDAIDMLLEVLATQLAQQGERIHAFRQLRPRHA